MLIKLNQQNRFDPNITTNTISAPISFNVKNVERKIEIFMGTWASVEALMAGREHIGMSYYEITGDAYFDMVESQSGNFLAIGDAIDAYLVNNGFSADIVVPTTLPVRPTPESGI